MDGDNTQTDSQRAQGHDLGLFLPAEPMPRVTAIEIVAVVMSVLWLVLVVAVFGVLGQGEGAGGTLFSLLSIVVPIALIWVAASTARTARVLRDEAARLQASVDAMRAAVMSQQQGGTADIRPSVVQKLDEIGQTQKRAEPAPATFTTNRADRTLGEAQPEAPEPSIQSQPSLALGVPPGAHGDPISIPDFIAALNFPENEHDREGFRVLRRALEDPRTERLVRASQDILTLLSQDGIYMDDLTPDRARPELWRRFAEGERGKGVSDLGGIRDRSALGLASGRIKSDPVFRDAAHHFLRHFDFTFMEFEKGATDAEIAALADTRTVRAFMLVGRVAGTFD